MDDLDVIRLAVVDIIPRERIARGQTEVKGKFGKRAKRAPQAIHLTLLQVFP